MRSSSPSRQKRLPGIDVVRLIGAFGVIVIHLSPSTVAAERFSLGFQVFCVPFFALISLYFLVPKARDTTRPVGNAIAWDRILVPYLIWSTLYLLMRLVKARLTGEALTLDWISVLFAGSAAVHLYFLPWLLYLQLILVALVRTGTGLREGKLRWQPLAILFGCLAYHLLMRQMGYRDISSNFGLSLVYCLLAWLLFALAQRPAWLRFALPAGALLLVTAQAWESTQTAYTTPTHLMLLAGFAAALLARGLPGWESGSRMTKLLSTYYGIYLIHFGWLEVLEFSAAKAGVNLAPYSVPLTLAVAAVVFIASLASVLLIRKSTLLAYLLLGEGRSPLTRKN